MRFGLYVPNFGEAISARSLADLAGQAESAGWDGLFLWDHMLYSKSQPLNMVDPWISLTAIAMSTDTLRFGTSVTPIARRRPWKLARETTTLDNLSGGRLILSVGLGEPAETEFGFFGEETDPKIRAEMLDEGLQVVTGLWSGKPFSYSGKHYQLKKVRFLPSPTQQPRIPIWVGGLWPNKAPLRRAARWDGLIPLKKGGWITPSDLEEILAYVYGQRTSEAPVEVAIIGTRKSLGYGAAKGSKRLIQLEEQGATWWLQSLFIGRDSSEKILNQIKEGPP
jgi:alkanesulfonate monooxygenase SsuD/methylene tetrahydromethanopterin reductase-like flavin-dependent oxidoreductase (luciferase family)